MDELLHEKAIGAAIMAYHDTTNDPEGEMDMGKAIKAYLSASGLVLVPREPTDEMMVEMECAAPALMSFSERMKSPSFLAWKAAIEFAPNPFESKQDE